MYDNHKRILTLLLLLAFIFTLFTFSISSEDGIDVSAKSAALYEPETKKFIYTKNSGMRLGMASTTKIMTALLAIEMLNPDENIEVDERAIGIEGSSVYLKSGEIMTAADLIYSVLLQSANDAAAALAYRIAGSIEAFAALMNKKAEELGLRDTNFTNPHGLDDKDHYTTAADLSVIAAEALSNESFKEISSTYKKEVTSNFTKRNLVNHNKMLKLYDGAIGVKTGFTKKSGRCLVSAAERDGLTLISVTINAPDDWRDHTNMLDLGYSLLEARFLARPGDFTYGIPVLDGASDTVKISNTDTLKMILNKTDPEIKSEVRLCRYFTAPITKGDILGTVIFTKDGEEIGRINLTAENSVEKRTRKHKLFS